jgi:HEAT repeat protein
LYFSHSVPDKVAAIRVLGLRRYTQVIPHLVEFCYDRNREIRTASIIALGMMKATEALNSYHTIIWDRSNAFTVWDKMSSVWAIGNYPNANVIPSLITVMGNHPNFKVALTAARSLSRRPETTARQAAYYWIPFLRLVP